MNYGGGTPGLYGDPLLNGHPHCECHSCNAARPGYGLAQYAVGGMGSQFQQSPVVIDYDLLADKIAKRLKAKEGVS